MNNITNSKDLIGKSFVRLFFTTVILALILFISSGKLWWIMAWIYVIVFFINSAVLILTLDPELIVERSKVQGDSKKWDIVLTILIAWIGPMAILIIAGLDVRYQWSGDILFVLKIGSLLIGLLGLVFSDWAILSNKYFSAVIRIQKDRDHEVVTTGPYRYIRHPGYAGSIFFSLFIPIALGSLWSYIPTLFTIAVTVFRAALEDKTLHNELNGYRAYALNVPYRLIPGVW